MLTTIGMSTFQNVECKIKPTDNEVTIKIKGICTNLTPGTNIMVSSPIVEFGGFLVLLDDLEKALNILLDNKQEIFNKFGQNHVSLEVTNHELEAAKTNKIIGIKFYRERTGASLADAKNAIESAIEKSS
jgi:hypothetical protein